jgi:integrase
MQTLPTKKGDADVRVAKWIWKTWCGWRVQFRHQGQPVSKRFTDADGEQAARDFLAGFMAKAAEQTAQAQEDKVARKGTLATDAKTYLALNTTKAMPTYDDRVWEIGKWVAALGARHRVSLTVRDLDEQLQAWRPQYSNATVNKFRTALMALYTVLDGVGAANPVKATRVYPEADQLPRGRDYALLIKILDAIPDRGRGVKGEKGSAQVGSQSKARLELFVWTGMTPAQMMILSPEHFNLQERWYVSPRREKGKQPRFPRPNPKKPMTDEIATAFARFVALNCWGEFSRTALRSVWLRAQTRVQAAMRKDLKNPKFVLPRVRLYDIRHSFGTAVTQDHSGNLEAARLLLDHGSERTTRRYTQAVVPSVLQHAATTFAARHSRAALRAVK